jgi:NADPH-dependent 2,4-dienoyl-CoA reductase/sulfur reductase-like enzyme
MASQKTAFGKPYWWEAAPREAPTDVALPARCDVAIIGAGYTGLSAALTLARAGRSARAPPADPAA